VRRSAAVYATRRTRHCGFGMGIGFALAVCRATHVASSRTTLTAVVRKLLDWTEVVLRFPKSRFPIDNSIPARI
jgi:hypothetical protein